MWWLNEIMIPNQKKARKMTQKKLNKELDKRGVLVTVSVISAYIKIRAD